MNTLPGNIQTICIEGVIGVGKTSLTNFLAKRFNARTVLEEVGENPFLSHFYQNRKMYAFQTQLWFLLSRFRQISDNMLQQDLFHQVTIADYLFAKDRIFASMNLDENEMNLYDAVARIMEPRIPPPDLVIYLQSSTDVLLKRIEKRGREYERHIDREYIETLNQTYSHYFFHYTATPLLVVNTNDVDFVGDSRVLQEIIDQIAEARSGITFYHPLGAADRLRLDARLERNPEGDG